MIYSEGIYSESEIFSQGIEIEENFIELKDDIIYYIYFNNKISKRYYYWKLYKYTIDGYVLVDSNLINTGSFSVNLNDYSLQLENNKFKIDIITKVENNLISSNELWYYYTDYSKYNNLPYYTGYAYDVNSGSSTATSPPQPKPHRFPTIHIKKLDVTNEDINIKVMEVQTDEDE